MKVNLVGILISFLAIGAVSKYDFLSAAGVPQSDEKKPDDSSSLSSTSSSETSTNATVTDKPIEKSSSSENASVEEASDTLPPLEFPLDDEKTLPKNDTALKILQTVSNQSSKSKEDSKSVESSSETILPVNITISSTEVPSSSPETVTENSTLSSSTNMTAVEEDYDDLSEEKNDAENIQENDSKATQDELEEEFAKIGSDKATINLGEDPVTNTPVLHSGHVALIFASTLVILSVLAYIGMILWRGRLEQRYGMRQRLVTEDDFYNNNDVRYFGL